MGCMWVGWGGGGDGRLLYISWLSTNEMKLYPMSTVNQWNTPNLEARTATLINLFCKHMPKVTKLSINFSFGKRCNNIIYIKLRHNCVLNYDFCNRNIINNPLSLRGQTEDVCSIVRTCF